MFQLPKIIQGGMGVGVSNWRLAQAVSRLGQLGVVSGTALDQVLVRRLADGDEGGHMRRGFDAFPFPEMAKRIWTEYFQAGGKPSGTAYPTTPMHQRNDSRKLIELLMVSNFVEIFLAREGHLNKVGVNFLEKVQLPHLASIYGAMLAGVGYVLMGAGIPLHIPGVLDDFAAGKPAEYKLAVTGAPSDADTMMRFDPQEYAEGPLPQLERPKFLAIVSSNTLASTMLRRASGHVDGFIIESPTAGGHNAPPRGKGALDSTGQPVYGERDRVDLAELRKLGVPFWMAGGYGSAEKLSEALAEGAAGVQVGTAFAFSEESGLRHDLKKMLVSQAAQGSSKVFTDPVASPTGFPFKVAQLPGTYSEAGVAAARTRVCDLGYLREAYWTEDGKIAYRCAAEPESSFVAKGGKIEETVGRKCLCNALLANIGHPQTRADGVAEPPLVTVGDDVNRVAAFLDPGAESYRAADVVNALVRKPV
ncbi:nitronate monooxygenase [Occallatibacter savannae]|uniref:nitronate monooxygenase n=1 Tax=Occallatibacter savannae TaxID=1002691 RepID=UPI000D691521|nr:nitronate monooxygenase [Occallatibacter savannae]